MDQLDHAHTTSGSGQRRGGRGIGQVGFATVFVVVPAVVQSHLPVFTQAPRVTGPRDPETSDHAAVPPVRSPARALTGLAKSATLALGGVGLTWASDDGEVSDGVDRNRRSVRLAWFGGLRRAGQALSPDPRRHILKVTADRGPARQGGPMDTGTRDMNRRVERLCPRHRVALRWASLRDRLPSQLAERAPRYRVEVLDRAFTCAGCRARNELGWRASAAPSGSGPLWNPTTATRDAAVTWGAWPVSGGYGDRRAEPGRSVHIGWVIAGASTLAITVGLAGLGVMSQSEVPAGDTRPPAGQTGERPVDAARPRRHRKTRGLPGPQGW